VHTLTREEVKDEPRAYFNGLHNNGFSDDDYFRLDERFLNRFNGKKPNFGFNGLGEFVFYRTYSRIKEDGTKESAMDTFKRVVEGCYEIQRRYCDMLHIPWTLERAQVSAQEMFTRMWEFKFLPPGRGLWAMGTKFMWERGSAALNNCFAAETEIITRDGIKKIGDLVGTTQTVLTTGGKWVNAPIRSFGEQELKKIVLRRGRHRKTIYATPDHRWFVKSKSRQLVTVGGGDDHGTYRTRECSTDQLKPNMRLAANFGQGINNNKLRPSPVGIMHGICFGDGTTGSASEDHGTYLYLCGQKNEELLKYFQQFHVTDAPERGSEGAKRVADLPRAFRNAPDIREARTYLYGWLAGYFAADGDITKKGTCRIASSERSNLELVKSVCAILGIGVHDITESLQTVKHDGKTKKFIGYRIALFADHLCDDFFLLSDHRERFEALVANRGRAIPMYNFWYVDSVDDSGRFEEVFCPQVPEYYAFTLDGNILTGNCGFISTIDIDKDPAEPFYFMTDMSMLGVGIGFDTRGAGKLEIVKPHNEEKIYVIPDTREGWANSVRLLVLSYTHQPELGRLQYDYSQIRPANTPIKGFGGKASGPGVLIRLHEMMRELLESVLRRPDSRLTSVDIVDMMNFIGKCVVAGNVRRTAEIAFGMPDDLAYITMKDNNIYPDEYESHRWASNNSVFADVGMPYNKLAKQTSINGEPGYLWLHNVRNYGRMIDGYQEGIDRLAMGANPCVEQSLESHELCCLVETFPTHHDNAADYHRTLKFAYLYGKTVTLLPTHCRYTNSVLLRNRRIGLSQSGIVQAFEKFGRRQVLDEFCDKGYKIVCNWDKIYADWLCCKRSIKKTSVKPSGTVSLCAGATAGIHYTIAPSRHYWRRVRIAADSILVKILVDAGYDVEIDAKDDRTMVAKFGVSAPNAATVAEVSIWEQIKNAVDYQRYWADNQVSCTVQFTPEEASQIPSILAAFDDELKGISFLPQLDHGHIQPPYEAATEEEVTAYNNSLKPIDMSRYIFEDASGTKFCDGDTCSVI